MISIFESLRNLVKISQVKIDNSVLVLHYPVSVILLLAFCVIVTAKEYVGKPIECLTDESIPIDIINTFCWMYTTFTVPQASYNYPLQSYPGIDDTMDEKQFKYHGYYQWVAFVLFIQAICFYLPHWLWKFWEGGKLEALSKPVNEAIYSGHHLKQKQHNLVKYLVSSRGSHDAYSFRFFICEFLALINISLQLYFLDKLFEGEFRQYGLEVINFLLVNDEQRIDPMARIFPKVTKCRFRRYGPSAGLDSVDALCLLPLNIINEKIYIFLWFWFLLLFLLTALTLLIHIMVISSRPLWLFVTKLTYSWSSSHHIKPIIQKSTYGDWFFLYMLGSNIDPVVLKNVLCELADNDDSINDSCDL